ncbi:MAG: hypothetical protein WC089_03710 [Candidatus Paceibacterota bacterium]
MVRKPKEINWDIVENQMEAGCTAKQIAHGKIHITNFYGRFKEHFGFDFANYANDTYECGDGILKFVQYMKAKSGKTKELDKLCDIRLGQAKVEEKVSPLEDITSMRHQIMLLQAEIDKLKEEKLNG